MSQEDKAKAKKDTNKRSGVMKLLGSTKITPILGLAAFLSILYYKNKSTKPPEKAKKAITNVDRRTPVLAPLAILGRTRENGPMLTKSLFSRGDLIVRKRGGKLELGVVVKGPKKILVQAPAAKPQPLLAWVKAGNGRFALLRVKKRTDAEWQRLHTALQAATKPALRQLHASVKLALPAPLNDPKVADAAWLAQLLKQSHYNDLDPR